MTQQGLLGKFINFNFISVKPLNLNEYYIYFTKCLLNLRQGVFPKPNTE